jgi:hypothetical protein
MNASKIRDLIKKWRDIAVKLDDRQTVMTANTHRLFANELSVALKNAKRTSKLTQRRKLLHKKRK